MDPKIALLVLPLCTGICALLVVQERWHRLGLCAPRNVIAAHVSTDILLVFGLLTGVLIVLCRGKKPKEWEVVLVVIAALDAFSVSRCFTAHGRRPHPVRRAMHGFFTVTIAYIFTGKWLFELLTVDWEWAGVPAGLTIICALVGPPRRQSRVWRCLGICIFTLMAWNGWATAWWVLHYAEFDGFRPVPKTIMRMVFTDEQRNPPPWSPAADAHPLYRRCHRSLECVFPNTSGFTHVIYSSWEEGRQCMRELFPSWEPLLAQGAVERVVLHDFTRYCLLFKHGGLYADVDYEVRRDFWANLLPGTLSIAENQFSDIEVVTNNLMASPPGHPFWPAAMCQVRKNIDAPFFIDTFAPGGMKPLSTVFRRVQHAGTFSGMFACIIGLCGACLVNVHVALLPCLLYQPNLEQHAQKKKSCGPGVAVEDTGVRAYGIHWSGISWHRWYPKDENWNGHLTSAVPPLECKQVSNSA